MKVLITTGRVLVGLVFMFSGVVKAIDPLGSAYKFHDYFQAFNLGFLDWFSLPLAILLCTAEFVAGFSVLTGIRFKSGISVVMILMLIFTPLTLILALTNPVSDCGCFGDAIHLTNWQTFWKNVILIAFAILVYKGRKDKVQRFRPFKEWLLISVTSLAFVLFCSWNLIYLPVVDFLPYKTGIKIAEQMVIPDGAPMDEYNTTFIYKKDGYEKEFSISDYPADDTSWVFVDQKSVLVNKGYQPPIHDFSINTRDGEDLTERILSNKGFTLLMVAKKMNEADEKRLQSGFDLGNYCLRQGIDFYILTSSGRSEIDGYDNNLPICFTDETTLKTMLRSNPGYMLIKDGIILDKWSWANVPDKEWFK